MNIVAWLRKHHPQLLDELLLLDRLTDGMLLADPEHTLSYNIAMAAQRGHWLAKLACHALNELSPNHCAIALAKESTQQWQEAVEEAG